MSPRRPPASLSARSSSSRTLSTNGDPINPLHKIEDGKGETNKPHFGMTGDKLNAWVSVACITAMTLFGYDQGVFGGIIVTPNFLELMGNPDPTTEGLIVSLYDIGCFVGALSTFIFGDRIGRKKSLISGVIVMSIGSILQAAAVDLRMMLVARIVTGLGNGVNTATSPVWQSETTRPALRGKLIVFGMIMNIAGFSLSNWMTYAFSYTEGSVSWRFPIAFQLVFSIIILATVPWLPESPRWLLAHGHDQEGARVLAALEGNGATITNPAVLKMKNDILDAVALEREERSKVTWTDIIRGRTGNTGMIKRLFLGVGVQWMQQLAGINVTSYYLPLVLQNSVGLSNNLSRLLAACNSLSYLAFAFIGLHLIERAGRRKMMITGAAGQAACWALIAGLLSQTQGSVHDAETKSKFGAGATAFFFLFYVFFGICWQGIPWLYPVEINSLTMRTIGSALSTGSNWISNFMVVQITPLGISSLGWKFYLIWMTFNASFVPIVYLFYPETANRHLEDMDRMYRENEGMVFVCRNEEAIRTERPERYGAEEKKDHRGARSDPVSRKVTSGLLERKGSAMRRRASHIDGPARQEAVETEKEEVEQIEDAGVGVAK